MFELFFFGAGILFVMVAAILVIMGQVMARRKPPGAVVLEVPTENERKLAAALFPLPRAALLLLVVTPIVGKILSPQSWMVFAEGLFLLAIGLRALVRYGLLRIWFTEQGVATIGKLSFTPWPKVTAVQVQEGAGGQFTLSLGLGGRRSLQVNVSEVTVSRARLRELLQAYTNVE